MSEQSVMRQARETWLRIECIELTNGLMPLSHAINAAYDSFAPYEPNLIVSLGVEPAFEKLLLLLIKVDRQGILPKETIKQYRDKVTEMAERYQSYDYATSINHLIEIGDIDAEPMGVEDESDIGYDFNQLRMEIDTMVLERFAECQCGKPKED